jgi:ankyrin repeat protein
MCPEKPSKLTAAQVLRKYTDDALPEFLDRPVQDVNQVGITGDRPIHVACIRGSLDDLIALIEGGAEVNAAGDLGYTPLHIAGSRGFLDIVRVLLRHGADVTAKNEFGQTPIDLARLSERDETAKALEMARTRRS